MRFFVAIILFFWVQIALIGFPFVANGQTISDITADYAIERKAALEPLFKELGHQSSPNSAKRTSKLIWQKWTKSGSDTIDLLMERASIAMRKKRFGVALDILDQVVTLAPDYVEGWNRRATLYYSMKQFGRSISDIEQVLALEPRHFGAIMGLAMILKGLGKDKKALETFYKVLEIYPAHELAQKQVIALEDKFSGSRT